MAKKVRKKVTKPKPTSKPAGTTAVEKKVAVLLREYADGAIDNAWDVIGDMADLDARLPKTSALRPAFDEMYGEIEEICRTRS